MLQLCFGLHTVKIIAAISDPFNRRDRFALILVAKPTQVSATRFQVSRSRVAAE